MAIPVGIRAVLMSAGCILAPVISAPLDGAVGVSVSGGISLAILGFLVRGVDTHQSTDWEVRTAPKGAGALSWSAPQSSSNKLSIAVPALTLAALTTYYVRVRTRGARYGAGPWSSDVSFTTVI